MTGHAEFDVVVVGAGPAGSSCAIRLASHGASVALIERSDFDSFRIGETVGPEVRAGLRLLGLPSHTEEPWGVWCRGISAAWGSARRDGPVPGFLCSGWRLDRRRFDRTLFDHAGSLGVSTFLGARIHNVGRRSGRWVLAIESGGAVMATSARFVVEATGRGGTSLFAPGGSRVWVDRLVGVSVMAGPTSDRTGDPSGAATVEATEAGWWYTAELPTGHLIAVFFTDSDNLPRTAKGVHRLLASQLRLAPATCLSAGRLMDPDMAVAWRTFDARSSVRRVAVTDGWAATGDALMAFDPLWGQGIAHAIGSGIEVADWLVAARTRHDGRMPDWVRRSSERFNRYLVQRARIYAHERRWKHSPFWKRRARGVASVGRSIGGAADLDDVVSSIATGEHGRHSAGIRLT